MSDDHDRVAARPVRLEPLSSGEGQGQNLFDGKLQLIRNLKVRLTVTVGKAEISVGELFSMREGSILKLDRTTNDPVELLLDGKVIAVGNLVAVEDNFGISITAINQPHP